VSRHWSLEDVELNLSDLERSGIPYSEITRALIKAIRDLQAENIQLRQKVNGLVRFTSCVEPD